jgi:small GTP-binding protein
MSNYRRRFFKVVVVGDGGVGKTTLIHRFIFGEFLELKMTVGTDIRAYTKTYDGDVQLELQLWDFAGEERFRIFLPSYCKGAKACILCYDITRAFSFQNLDKWYKIIKENTDNAIIYLVGCKFDKEKHFRAVKRRVAKKFQSAYKIEQFFETSSKTGYNNEEIFNSLTDSLYYNHFLTN